MKKNQALIDAAREAQKLQEPITINKRVLCKDCKWVHEADSVKNTSFMGVELCPRHAAAPELLEALLLAEGELNKYVGGGGYSEVLGKVRAIIVKAQGES